MACNIITQFRTKPGRADDLIALIRKNLSESAHHSGCVKISIQQNQDDPNDVISNQSWETRKHYESYFTWRAEEGLAAEIQSLCAEPVSMRFFNEAAAATPSKPASDTKGKDKEGNPTMTTSSLVGEQEEVVRQFFQRFSAGDIPGVISLFRDDASYWLATTRETLGMSQLPGGLKFVQSRLEGSIRYEIGPMVAEPNKIAVQVEGFAKTVEGASYNNLYHVYFELEGDKIVRAREYNDTAHVFDTLRAGERRRAGTANSIAKDKEALVSIVKEMSESMTGAQSTRHWAEDALWFDIPPFASRGIQPALKFFDRVFGSFRSCNVDILETEVAVNGDMGLVCTIQKVNVVLKTGDAKRLVVRETDCFERRNSEWKLIHQHTSVPAGGEWDGKITTA